MKLLETAGTARQLSLVVGLSDLATNFLQMDQQAGAVKILARDLVKDLLVVSARGVLGGGDIPNHSNHTVDGRHPAARYGTLYCN